MKEYTSKGIICIKDQYGITYHLCELTYKLLEDESFEYCFKPNYSVIDLLEKSVFDTIPGINLDFRKEEYVRKNIVPTFISERVINENREDYYEELKKRDMEYMDPVVYMIRSTKNYSGDRLFMVEHVSKKSVDINLDKMKNNSTDCIKKILIELAQGNNVVIGNLLINDANRKQFYDLLCALYKKSLKSNKEKQKEGIAKAKILGKYKGRKPKRIESFKVLEMANKVKNKELTAKKAASELGISIDKYYRELKVLQNKKNTLLQ